MVLKAFYIIELTEAEEGGLELVDPSWCPEEGGPPRKKIKSPPVISPTGSSTSLYSGGSSSIDWTTTGTTLEMQGTRVTRTQYGFRTLQESSAKMCLKVTGYPLPEITWYKDDVLLHEDDRHTFYADEDGFFAMTIDPVQVDDTGRYTCMATNEYGQASTSAFFRVLKVEKEAAPPAFVNKLKDQECQEGEVVNFECEVEGWPEPELLWLVDDQPLRPSHDFKLQYDGQTAKLEIRDAQPDDTGVYTVKIQNEFGTAESKAELIVQPDPDKNHVEPEFQAMIEDVECNEGDEVRFKAVFTGDPTPEISWTINGIPITESEKIRFISEDGICIITIKDVTRHFDGIVICQAANRLGTTTCDGRLKVRVPPAPPVFNKPLEDKVVQENNNAVFEVDVSGWPEPNVVFSLKGKELKHGVDGVEIQSSDGYFRIVINICKLDDHDGEIVARATNEHGTAESRARLTVEPPEEESRSAPTFIKDIEDQTVKEGEFAVFETTVKGNPNPDVSWYINGHKMDESTPGIKIEVINHDHKLTIDSASYAGTVLCRAENSVGRFETKARLIVIPQEPTKKPPQFTERLVDKTETEQNTVVFEVRVDGYPKPTVKWFLNGTELTKDDSRVEIREFEGSYKLELRNLSTKDTGEIKCVAENSEGKDETSAKLTVNRKPFAPVFDESPSNQTVTKEEKAEFRAHADAMPPAHYTWSIDGRKIRESTEGCTIREENGVSILEIDTLIHNSATVSVIAENSLGMDETGARLTVNPKVEPIKPVKTETAAAAETIVTREEERVTAESKDTVTQEGTIVVEPIVTATTETTISATETTTAQFTDTVTQQGTIVMEPIVTTSTETTISATESRTAQSTDTVTQQGTITMEPITTTSAAAISESVTSESRDTVTQEGTIVVEPIPGSATLTETHTTTKTTTTTTWEAVAPGEEPKYETTVLREQTTVVKEHTGAEEIPKITVTEESSSFKKDEVAGAQLTPTQVSVVEQGRATVETTDTVTQEGTITVEPIITTTTQTTISAAETSTAQSTDTVPQQGTILLEPIVTSSTETTTSAVDTTTAQSTDTVPQQGTILVEPIVTSSTETTTSAVDTTTAQSTDTVPQQGTILVEPIVTSSTETTTSVVDTTTAQSTDTVTQTGKIVVEPIVTSSTETTTSAVNTTTAQSTDTVTPQLTIIAEPITTTTAPKTEVEQVTVTATEESRVETQQVTTEEKVSEPEQVTAEIKDTVTPETEPKLEKDLEKPVELEQPKMNGDVKPEPEIVKVEQPRITRELQSQTVTRGDLAHFEIVVEKATEIQWKHNETVLTSSTNGVKLSQDDKFEFRLSLDSAIFSEGTISIVASNSAGSVSSKTDMKVLEIPKETHKPEFTDKLRDLEVTRGDSVRMDVIALHSPEYKWFINDQVLESGKNGVKIITEDNKSSLIIENFQDFHNGTVRVEASNEVGTSESTAKLRLLEPAVAPRITDAPTYQDIKEGETAEFKATVTGVPTPTIKWSLNEKVLEESSTVTITSSGEECTLRIKDTVVSQTGKVQINVQNSAGADQRIVELKVNAVHFVPEFTSSLTDKTVTEGEPLRWDLRINKPSPDTAIQWLLNGKELKPDDNVQIADNGDGSYSLTIKNSKPEMSGTITAKAKNPAGETETSAKVQVNTGDKRPEFTKTPQNHETYIAESIKFSAIVIGTPVPQVSWFLNGTKLENSEEIKVKHEVETGKTSIRIHKPKLTDSGEVKVVAENSAGKVETTVNLKVETKPEVPKFTSNMDDRQVPEDETVKFTSTIEGFPAPQVEWTLNGEPVAKYSNIKVSDEGKDHTIEITGITPEQAGELSCQATNPVGWKKQNVILAVKMVGDAPTFVKNLEDQLVAEGEITVMEAKMNEGVKPKPKVTWYKDGQELLADEHWKLEEREEGVYRLKILETKMEDKGRITIKAENHFGSAECAASLGVTKKRPMAKPAFQSEIAPITLTEGDSLQTKLLITGDPTPFVKWYINNTLVCETEDTEIKNANGVYSLTIHGVTADMSGKIKCTAYNKAGEAKTEGPLKVLKPIPVEFETSLCDATCREGDTLKLKAVLLGEPTPVVSWYVNGKKLEESQNIKIHAEKGTYTVTIKDITCDYSGKVVCEAVNEYGTASSEAMLLVLPRGEPPDFLEWLSNVRARQSTKVVHKVVFTGDPRPTLTWFINNKEVVHGADGGDITIVTDEKTSILTINSFNPDVHVGEIICKAENDAGEVSCTANMATYTSDMFSESESEAQIEEFAGDDMTGTDEESLREEIHRTPTPVMAPKFITKIKDTKTKKGHEAIFECVVPDTKGVCCKWLKDGKEIELIARIRVQTRTIEGHVTQELIIDDVQPEDAGKYTVIVENSAGREVCEASLTVLEDISKPSQKAPEFLVALKDKQVQAAEKVVFECKVDGEPKPTVQWYHEDKLISESSNIVIESIEETQRLIINSTEVASQGLYSCVAQNTAGTTKTEAKLSVQAQAPVFTKELENRNLSIGEKLTIMCSVKGQPQPHVDFFCSETKLISDSRISIEHDATNTHWRCVVSEFRREEFGSWRAVATNAAGTATSTCKIEEKTTAPVFEQGLKKTSVKEKEEIRMEVKVSGTSPDVEFFKDGNPVDKDANHDVIKNPDQGTFTLVVKEATLGDAGTYSVKATNPAGVAESSAETTVEQLLETPKFVKELASTDIKISETATLSVTVKGVPAPEVSWFKDGTPVSVDGSHIVSKKISDEEYSLTINSVNSGDAGNYSCKAVNKAGEAKSDAQVTIAESFESPRFVKELASTEVKVSESATLSITVKGVPTPEVQWFKDDKPVTADGSHIIAKKITDEEYSLTINSARFEDAGKYSCKAVNKAGEAKTEANFAVVKSVEGPEFTEKLHLMEVKETETLNMSVTVTGSPKPKVAWFRDGEPVQIDNAHVISKSDENGHHSLIIKDANASDVGVYSCKATNEAGEAKTEAKMGVIESIEAPHFVEGLKPLDAEEGKPLELTVTVEGKPEPEITFTKDGVPIHIDNQHEIRKDGEGHHTLFIKGVTSSDVGSYSCKAVNKAGQDVTLGEIRIPKYSFEKAKVEEVQPLFVEPLHETTASEGETIVMTCKVNKESKPEIRFYRDDKPVDLGPHMVLDVTDDGSIKLTINNATKEDVGAYRCEAVNKAGTAKTTAELKLQYATQGQVTVADEQDHLETMVEEIAPKMESAISQDTGRGAPEFIELLRSCTVAVQQQAVLRCKVTGEPRPKIKWTRDGKEVEMSARIKTDFKEDGSLSLTIDKVEQQEAGEYRCFAENEFGSAWTEGPIIVTLEGAPVPSGDAPDFIQPVRPIVVDEGETAVLEGKISGKPKPTVKWYKNGTEMTSDDRVKIESLEDGTHRITVKDARMDDMDEYRCEASNEYGDVWSDVTLTVKEKIVEAPAFTKELKAQQVTEGKPVEFDCKVTGLPKPEVKWFKDGEELKEDTRIHFQSQEDGTEKLFIDKSKVEDQGNYRVEITNPGGSESSKAPLTVEGAETLKIKKGLEDIQTTKGTKIILSVEVEGKPKTVKWYKGTETVVSDSRTKIEKVSDAIYHLQMENTELTDSGSYRVVLSTESESVESSCRVTVVDTAAKEHIPVFKKGLNDQQVPKGSPLVLEVEIDGLPKSVKWYKNGDELKGEDLGDGKYRLTVPDFKDSDIGDYCVVASNEVGEVESRAKVTVEPTGAEGLGDKPQIVSGLLPTTVSKGEAAVFTVKTKGPVKGVKWYKNGKEIENPKTKDLGDGVYQLEIPNADKEDAADYKVVVSNDAGDVDSSAALNVKFPGEAPKIVSGLVPTAVKKGETATFSIKTQGPVKTVKWYKNGKEIENPKTKDLGDGEHQLEIPNTAEDDTADYKVVVSNDDGSADSGAALTVKLPAGEGPKIVSGLVPTSVNQGETATFRVKVAGPVKQVKWYKNGKELENPKTKDLGDGEHQLEIPNAGEVDTADYKVVVSNDDGSADSAAALTVKLPAGEGPKIVSGLVPTTVKKGETATFSIKTKGSVKTVKWYKNGKEIENPKTKDLGEGEHQLEIPNAAEDDTADYKVVVSNDDGSADSSAALTVKLPAGEAPKIVSGLVPTTVNQGETATFKVKVAGPVKQVKWYKNGKEIQSPKAKDLGDGSYELEIPDAKEDDIADYKVVVSNDDGSADSSAALTVKLPPKEPQLTFLKPLKDIEVTEGENAVFKVETNAKPKTVKWYKNGQEIKPDARVVTTEDGNVYKLVISKTTKDDAAKYLVTLTNETGSIDSSASLTVKKALAPICKILKGLEDRVVAKGTALVFEVKVEGTPEEVKWNKDGVPVTAGANAVIEKIDDQTYRLTIPKADIADAGRYNVELSNSGGKVRSEANGEVDEKPEIVKGLESLELQTGDDDVFKVEVSAPVRTVKWYKNGQEIKPDRHLEPKKIGPKKYELAINKAVLDDSATYKVVLGNAAGECDSEAALTVSKPNILKILEGLKDLDVLEGQPIDLKVKVEGRPKTVKWYKNGQELAPSAALQINENADSGEYSLSIPSSQKSDGAAYRVVLTNEKGEVYSGSVVYVKAAKPTSQDVGANFMSPLKDTEVEEGETLTLKCTVGGSPFPTIKWEKDGVELKKDDRIVMREAMDGTVTLRIRDVKKSDFGQYRVTATNDAGSATSACQVTVTDKGEENSKPHFIIPLKSCEAAPGEKKEFSVKLRGFPRPALEWFLNGKPLQLNGRITVEDMGDGNFCLTIKDVQASDYGTIRCVAKNEMGEAECQAEFEESKDRLGRDKDDDRYPPRFNVPLWDRHIPVNDPLSVECHVDARPTAEVEWFKDGIKLISNEIIEIRNTTDGACRLRIAKFTQEETGTYTCVATNELGQADTRATYSVEVVEEEQIVKRKEYAPKFNPGLSDQSVNAGQGIRLTCVVDGVPKATVTWYKDGLPLRTDSRTTIEYAENGTCTLMIKEALENDEGAYRCVATNEHGTINTSCLVTVKVPKTVVQKEGEEPFFTKGLADIWTDRGDTFTLRCAVKGDPFPEIKWYRNGQLIRNGSRTIVDTTSTGECILTVKECTMSDEGIYRCEAENKHGKAKTQATAHVQMAIGKGDKPKLEEGQAPRFIIPLEDATIIMGGLIDLECKVTGTPMPQVKWSKDGGPIWEDARYDWDIDEAKGTYSLRIKNACLNDEGTYRCVATNESGSATTKSFIRIDDGLMTAVPSEKSAPPRFAIKLGDARAVEGQPLKFECKIEGSPLPELTWHKDGAQIHPSDRVQLSMDPDGTARLVIPSCTMDDDGIYRVIAKNPAGSAHDKGTATVKRAPKDTAKSPERETFDANKAPKVVEALENVRVPEKDRLHLRCKFSGDPKPSIKWFKDGERVFPYGRLQLKESPDGVCELIVDSSARQDAGGYRCVAENTYGSARTACDVNVILKERKPRDIMGALSTGKAPGFTVPLTIKRAKPGASVTFECLPHGTPFPNIKWLKDGIELIADDKINMESMEDGTQRLTLHGVDFFSEGYFRCVATNEHGTASTKAELVIEGERGKVTRPAEEIKTEPDESKPRIRRGLHNMSIHQGNTVEMIVCATGWPTPTVKWFKDGEEIISDGAEGRRVTFTDERGIHHLVILNCGPEDEGEYSLEATNKLGSAKTEGALNIIRPRLPYDGDDRGGMPFPPGFVRQLKNKHVFNRMPTIFDCLVVGHPAPEVEWFHNGKKIIPGGRVKIQSCGGGSHAIIILDTTTDDAGEYVAIAKNCHGTASSSAILDVTVPYLDNIKFNGEIDVTPYLTEEYGFKKVNYASLPTPPDRGPFIKEVTGHYLTLSWIPTKRAPPRYPQVTYVIEIRELPEKEWTMLDYNIPEPVCKVRNLELGKSYQFRVRAENIYGISDPSPASPPSRLMAPPQPVFDKRTRRIIPLLDPYAERALEQAHAQQYACAPWFAPGVVEKRYCAENDTLTIILNVSGYPDPNIQWKFRGWDIDTTSPTSKCKVYTYGGTETTLAISGFSKENVGQYQCFAVNEYGEAQQNIMVELATRPSFIQPLMDKTFSSAHPLKLDVRVDGQPFPELKWMKDWRPLVESSRVKFVQDGPYLCSLIINDPLWRDSGIYSCMAINEAGQATTSCTVTVEADGDYNDVELPKKRVGIEARKVREIYEIEEEDEQLAASGAPFHVREKRTGRSYLAQLKPSDATLKRNVDVHNALEQDNCIQFHQVIRDGKIGLVVYENATGTLLDSLVHPGVSVGEPQGANRERIVQIFVRQLLLALKHMHDMKIAHLDLRPETILLQDNRLKLADFGQSRRLLRGIITGEVSGSPEFVSPEIVRGYPLTLATDLWSVGTLTYVLLSGLSPFHGDNDEETLRNVDLCQFSLDIPELGDFSNDAIDFISRLLKEIPMDRLSCEEALQHPWLSCDDISKAKLPADGLREFKYRHKWLERRVFVQQTPSEQLLDAILAPSAAIAAQKAQQQPAEKERPVEVYDYLRIKPRPPATIEEVPKKKKEKQPFVDEYGRVIDKDYFLNPQPPPQPPQGQAPFDLRGRDPRDSRGPSRGHPGDPRQDPRQQSPDSRKVPLDQFGRIIRKEDLARIPHDSFGRPISLDDPKYPQEQQLGDPIQNQRAGFVGGPGTPVDEFGKPLKMDKRPPPPEYAQSQKKKLVAQEKPVDDTENGETPSKTHRGPPKQQMSSDSDEEPIQVPLRMIRGEHRQIEEEIANRILSDISEEGSIAGSLASLDDLHDHPLFRHQPQLESVHSRSRSSTPKADRSNSSTPTISPVNTVKESNYHPLDDLLDDIEGLSDLPDNERQLLEAAENDPNIPVGAPLFLEGLHGHLVVDTGLETPSPKFLSPKSPRRSTPGTKSPILLSPGKEHSMEVLIAMKRGKPSFLPPGENAPELDDEDAHMDKRKKQAKPSTDSGTDFRDLQKELDKDKYRKKLTDLDDLDKYRPKNIYKEDIDFDRPQYDIDDSPWDSHYQIGPDTYLMATRGATFNSRVRDYRRNLWGDGAPYVTQGMLGVRNGEVTVKERRRFTDILRENQSNLEAPKTSEGVGYIQKEPSVTAIDRIKSDIQKVSPTATKKNADGTYAPIFVNRLRDVYLSSHSATFECQVTSSPPAQIQWLLHGKQITSDAHVTIQQTATVQKLTVNKPLPYDLGEYSCVATNEYGTDKTTSRLISGEAPSRPGRPDCELSSDTELFITWEAPEGPTYLEGINYRLEYRMAGPSDSGAPWIIIHENVDDEAVVVKHLHPLGIYQFRVTARNGFGLGVPSLSSRIVQTHGRGAPKLQVETLRDHCRLNVVTLPQRSARQLNEISEESESDETIEERIEKDVSQIIDEDPTKRYQLEHLLFKGKFSVIRQAVDSRREGSAHCIAKIRDASEVDSQREFELLRDSHHENVQRLDSAYTHNNFLYLFCEQLYENVFQRFTFMDYYTEEQVAMTVRQVTSALHWIHFRGIAHLDVNPYNIMFQSKRNWITKLVDFGSAQKTSALEKPKDFNVLWCAPEYHIPDVSLGVQSDMWGLGVVTFCLLGGFHPFTSEYDHPDEVKENVLNVKCDPNLIPVNASQESLSFATWALKKSPVRRMRTDEGLGHRFLATDPSMVRRREAVKYAASRLRKTAQLTKQQPSRPISDRLENTYGAKTIQH